MDKLVMWVEIPASDFKRAVAFYQTCFDAELQCFESDKEKMACFASGEGAISYSPNLKPSKEGVLVSLHARTGINEALNLINAHGGQTVIPKTKIEAEGKGYFATFIDSEGNTIGLYED